MSDYKKKYLKYKLKYLKLKNTKGGYSFADFGSDFVSTFNNTTQTLNAVNNATFATITDGATFLGNQINNGLLTTANLTYDLGISISQQLYQFINLLDVTKLTQLFYDMFSNIQNPFGVQLATGIRDVVTKNVGFDIASKLSINEISNIAALSFKELFNFLNVTANPISKHIECLSNLKLLIDKLPLDNIKIDDKILLSNDDEKSLHDILDIIEYCLNNLLNDLHNIKYTALIASITSVVIPGAQPGVIIAGSIIALVSTIILSINLLLMTITSIDYATISEADILKKIEELKKGSENNLIFNFIPDLYNKLIICIEKYTLIRIYKLKHAQTQTQT